MSFFERLFRKQMQVERGAPQVNEKKGYVSRGSWDKTVSFPANLDAYEKYYREDSEVHAAVNVLADMTVGVGYYTESENERAKEIVDDFAELVGLDQILLNVVKSMFIYGFCPVERYLVKGPPKGKLKLKLLPARTVHVLRDRKGKILGYKQKLDGHIVNFKPREIVWFVYNQVGVSPYGTSIVSPILSLVKAKAQTHVDMPKIIHRYSSPLTVWETAADVSALKDAITDREPNEDIFLGHVGKDDVRFKAVEIDPRGRFTEYIKDIEEGILEGLQAPLLRYLRNATEASAKTMLEVIGRHVQGVQRYVKRVVERQVFTPLLASYGISDVPSINWGVKKTGVEDLDLSGIADLVSSGALTPGQAQDLLVKMGLPLEEAEDLIVPNDGGGEEE